MIKIKSTLKITKVIPLEKISLAIPSSVISCSSDNSWLDRRAPCFARSIKPYLSGCNLIFFSLTPLFQPTLNFSLKVAFYQKVRFIFQISKSIFQITILNLKFEIPTYSSKQQSQISSSGSWFAIIFLEIWKTNLTFWKKSHL